MHATTSARALPRLHPLAAALPLAALFLLLPLMARADGGAHLHPHGVELWWVVAAAVIGASGGWLAAKRQGRK
jgi:hypothetical protein